MRKIRGILFDKDGTLLDFNATWLDLIRQIAFEAAGEVQDRCNDLLTSAGLNPETGTVRSGSPLAAGTSVDLVEALYPAASTEELRNLVADTDRRSAEVARDGAVPLPGIVEALASLRASGYHLGVATNDSTTGAEETLLSFGVAHLFSASYGYDAVANPKPAPDVIHAFADTTGLRPFEVAMVGDNTHDLECAHAAGAGLAIGVLSGNSARAELEPLADVILDSVADLPDYLASES